MTSPYPSRFKMLTMPSYDGSTDADEHLENYQAHMLIQSANEAALCKSFCLTLTGTAQQWYRRLPPGSIDSFQQLASSFSAAFLGSRTRKLGASHLFGIKQRENETLKKYLERPTSFAHLRGIARRHAEADEYVRGRGLEVQDQDQPPSRRSERGQNRQDKGKNPVVETRPEANPSPKTPTGRFRQYTPLVTTIEHVLNQVSGRGLLRDPPPIWTDRSRRNQNISVISTRIRAAPAARQNPGPSNRTEELEPEHIVHTIFGGTATGDTASSRRSYAREARRFARGEYINMAEHISKICRQDGPPITFTDDEADRLLHLHNDALVGEIRVANNVVRRVLIDNGSSADVIFMDAFLRLKNEGATLTPM
ncbi:hypothetical protein TIFTF001_022359 [Ficus carica]|uniref:Retrotransposon gag domain-containing protein n=1 Tax=Ficus carica TaxID=3494 RepID=A0AA88ALX3_FICCA|nr:hypothetical protein TIFTF001_022359 [Ficus carica]